MDRPMDDKTISISISGDKREFVAEELAIGGYANEAEVVNAGLALLEKRRKIETLKALIAEGDADFDCGDSMTLDEPGELARYIIENAKALK
jgi:putative addiction module CopG family antidote